VLVERQRLIEFENAVFVYGFDFQRHDSTPSNRALTAIRLYFADHATATVSFLEFRPYESQSQVSAVL
jgi:hypothetical protein